MTFAAKRALRRLVALAALTLAPATGCIHTSDIRPTNLTKLDGYDATQPGLSTRSLQTLEGGQVTYGSGSVLALDLPHNHFGGKFSKISVRDGWFQGQTPDGRLVQAPVADVRAADVTNHNVVGTALIFLFGALLVGAGVAAYVSHRDHSVVTPGRALRLEGRAVVARPSTADGWSRIAVTPDTSGLSPAGREALAAFWTENARAEHAAVPAFSRLSLTLMAHGAPSELVESAHRAALEEIEHARLSFALASAYAGETVAPGALDELGAAPAVTASTLEALAAESLVDGCFLEGMAAAVAAETLARARDTAVLRALTVITRDERAHAELGWNVVAWCCAQGGPALVRRVYKLAHQLVATSAPRDLPAAMHAELSAHGWLAPAAWRALRERTSLEVAARAATLLRRPPLA